MSNLFDLTGKVAVVTGSTKGIGKAIAQRMAEHGARLVISSRKQDACDAVAAEIRATGAEAIAIACNVSEKSEIEGLIAGALDHYGQVDILVCNAAVNPYYGPLAKIDDRAYDRIMETNVRSNLWLANLVQEQMAERRDGAIIFVSSIAGLKGSSILGAYGLSKAADMQLARNLAVEWGPNNIRVNCIAPGLVKTDMARALYEDPKLHDKTLAMYPIGRLGEPDDIAGAAVFLASRAGAWITGQTLVADGGVTIGGGG